MRYDRVAERDRTGADTDLQIRQAGEGGAGAEPTVGRSSTSARAATGPIAAGSSVASKTLPNRVAGPPPARPANVAGRELGVPTRGVYGAQPNRSTRPAGRQRDLP